MLKKNKYFISILLVFISLFGLKKNVLAAPTFYMETYKAVFDESSGTFGYSGDEALDEDGEQIIYSGHSFVKYFIDTARSSLPEVCPDTDAHTDSAKVYGGETEYNRCWAFCASDRYALSKNPGNNEGAGYVMKSKYKDSDKCIYYKSSTEKYEVDCSRFVAEIILAARSSQSRIGDYNKDGLINNTDLYDALECSSCSEINDASAKVMPAVMMYQSAQVSIWDFIARNINYDTDFKYDTVFEERFKIQTKVKGTLINNSEYLKKMMNDAYNNLQKTGTTTENLSNSIKVETIENKLFYVSDCGNSDKYISKKIRLTNKYTSSLYLTVRVPSYVSICNKQDGTDCVSGARKYTVGSNMFKDIYLRVDNPDSDLEFNMSVDPDFVEEKYVNNSSCYDSVYFASEGNSAYQDMIVLTDCEDNDNVVAVDALGGDPVKFSVMHVTHRTCQSVFGDKYSSNTDSESGVCKNNTDDSNKYISELSGCYCDYVTLSSGAEVAVLVKEDVKFQFGNLTPGTLFAGGGFKFVEPNDDGTVNGITTEYMSTITWEFKDIVTSSKIPYYYNEPYDVNYDGKWDSVDTSILLKLALFESGSKKKELEERGRKILEIAAKLEYSPQEEIHEKYKNYAVNNDVSLSFFTYADDGSSIGDDGLIKLYEEVPDIVKVKVNIPESEIESNSASHVVSAYSGPIKMNKACFDKNGRVKYFYSNVSECDVIDDYYSDGGNFHYIPLDYSYSKYNPRTFPFSVENASEKNLFPFWLSNSELSLVGSPNILFTYSAECSVEVATKPTDCIPGNPECPNYDPSLYGIRYRSIDVNNPFPKNVIPSNWQEWWLDNYNQHRLNDTFYYGDPLYKISFKEINWNNDEDYNSWSGMNFNGSSDFVNDALNGFVKTSGIDDSYCELGVFNESCDSLHN